MNNNKFFHFNYVENVLNSEKHPKEHKLYFLNEERVLVPQHKAKRFIVKKKTPSGFKEFFGIIRNPNFVITDENTKSYETIIEGENNLYHEYHLDETLNISIQNRNIPLYVPKNFLDISPPTFANVKRTKEQLATNAQKRRKFIYDWYKNKIQQFYLETLTEVKCTSVADMYEYLNSGNHWKTGQEFYGYVDGLYETGGFLSISLDGTQFDEHTAVHELGHATSYYFSNEFFDKWYEISSNKEEEPPTEYGKTEISEDIAETFGFYFGRKDGKEMLKKKYPKRFSFMQEFEQANREGLVKNLKVTSSLTTRFKKYDLVVYK